MSTGPWQASEERILRRFYPSRGWQEVHRRTGRSQYAIWTRASEIGLSLDGRPNNPHKWSQDEIRALRDVYPMGGISAAKTAIPSRTWQSIYHMAKKLRLKSEKLWSLEEVSVLKATYPHGGAPAALRRLRQRDAFAIRKKAHAVGLRHKSPNWTASENAIVRRLYAKGGYAPIQDLLPQRSDLAIHQRAVMLGACRPKRPTSLEQQFMRICTKNNLPFRYTGDRGIWIAGMNPDFVHCDPSRKLAVEVAAPFYHWHGYPRSRRRRMAKAGWTCIVFYESRLSEKKVLRRLKVLGIGE